MVEGDGGAYNGWMIRKGVWRTGHRYVADASSLYGFDRICNGRGRGACVCWTWMPRAVGKPLGGGDGSDIGTRRS